MKIIFKFLTISILLMPCITLQAQLGKRLGDAIQKSAENTTVRKAEQKTDQAVSKAIDKATDPNTYKDDKKEEGAVTGNNNQPTNENSGNNARSSGANAGSNAAQTPQQGAKALEMAYAKSDFVAGDVIFFDDDLVNEKLGEFPSQWDLSGGNAEVASINGVKCISLIGYASIIPLMKEKNFLPDVFTIEFDVFGNASNESSVECEIGFNAVADTRVFIGRTWIGKDKISVFAEWKRPDNEYGRQNDEIKIIANEWHHVSVSFNQRAMKYYIDGVRYVNIPNMKAPANFWLWAREGKAYFKNIRITKGAVPLYDRMMSDGKFITYGITFDVGKSTIKPESMGEINRIATLMKENPDLKFSVEGHTDNTGSAATNQTLSEARSQAVVDKLMENGIAADRLKAAGKGQTSPIADNGSDEGRAKNRRVEFVKM